MSNSEQIIKESFSQYSAAVIQSRALVDVRDFLKPSARQIFYSMLSRKLVHKNPFKKTAQAVGMAMADFYIHGDSSCEGIIMRAAQNFALRYPIVEVKGNQGSLIESGNWAAPRYTESRLGEICDTLFRDIDKDTINEWRDSYDNTKQYPGVLPTKGFYNIVNGTSGIATGMASSIPQFNIKDVNKALEVLLLNPKCSFEDIYCCPDFATGGYLINEKEVKEALKYGSKAIAKENGETGASCKLRSKIDYNKKENCLIVTEIPYSVYTNTICGQLEAILEDDELNPGIDRFNDLTGVSPNIKIYLKKGIDPDRVIRFLYKNTSLQYHFAINMTMLNKGRFPKVFSWKDALQAHINHEKIVYRRGFEFDLNKINNRIHIIIGLLICLASIDEVIETIRSSESTVDANSRLQKKFLLDEEQSKAVLDMKLSRLAHLEVKKLENEKESLEQEKAKIEKILNNEELFNNELIAGWRTTANKFGDDRRTKVITISEEPEDKEIEEIKPEECVVITTKSGKIKRIPLNSFKVQNRNTKGVKSYDDIIMDSVKTNTIDHIMFFADNGKMYRTIVDNIPNGTNASSGMSIKDLVNIGINESIVAVSSLHRKKLPKYAIFITAQGMVKKTLLTEYMSAKRNGGVVAIKLADNDKVVNVIFMDDEDLILVSKKGMSIRFKTSDINAVGRATMGVKGMKLAEGDELIAGMPVHKETDQVALFSSTGRAKKIPVVDFVVQGRGGKGAICYKNNDVVGVAMISDEDNILIHGNLNNLVISATDIPVLSKTAEGNIMIKNNRVNSICKI